MRHTLSQPELLDVATRVAWAGGRRTLGWFTTGVAVEHKEDGSPVTEADRQTEALMRRLILEACPGHTVVGEEHGTTEGDPRYRWVIDPIDGTKAFVSGVPLYGTLVGLEIDGEPTIGAIYMPGLDELVAASRGAGCTWNGRRCGVERDVTLDQALLVVTDQQETEDRLPGWGQLARDVRLVRTWADCYGYLLVATGRAHVAIDPAMNEWDCAALLPIIEEAGGRFTDWRGNRTTRGCDAFATNGTLHESILEHLACAAPLSDDGP